MKRIKQNNKGAIVVIVLLVCSVLISASTALLSTSVMNFKMKKLNSRVKRVFYTAEGALEEAYIIAVGFVESAMEYANNNENFNAAYLDYLLGDCEDLEENNGLVEVLKDKKSYFIYKECNTQIHAELFDKADFFQLEILACSIDDKVEKELKLICKILIPEDGFLMDSVNPEDLICVVDWKLER